LSNFRGVYRIDLYEKEPSDAQSKGNGCRDNKNLNSIPQNVKLIEYIIS